MDISGKVAVVTGGASGLGEATVRAYLKGGKAAIFDMNAERGNALVNVLVPTRLRSLMSMWPMKIQLRRPSLV